MSCYVFLLASLACVSAGSDSLYQTTQHGYHGPLARPVVRSDGYLADTEEVAAARYAQYVALANAVARSGAHDSDHHYSNGETHGYGNYHHGQSVYSYGGRTGHVYVYTGVQSTPLDHGYDHGGQGTYGYGDYSYVGHDSVPRTYGHEGRGQDGNGVYTYGQYVEHHSTLNAHGHGHYGQSQDGHNYYEHGSNRNENDGIDHDGRRYNDGEGDSGHARDGQGSHATINTPYYGYGDRLSATRSNENGHHRQH